VSISRKLVKVGAIVTHYKSDEQHYIVTGFSFNTDDDYWQIDYRRCSFTIVKSGRIHLKTLRFGRKFTRRTRDFLQRFSLILHIKVKFRMIIYN